MSRAAILAFGPTILLAACASDPAIVRQAQKAAIVQALRHELSTSVEAEKSAVMATTDEESSAFAEESRRRTAEIERLRDDLHAHVVADGRAGELEKLAAFDVPWAELRDVDARLLALAVANSNLKAARLAAGEGAVATDRLVDALADVAAASTDPSLLRALAASSVSALRIQALLAPHVASPDDAEMTRLEEQMRTLGATVDAGLEAARSAAPATVRGRVTDAEAAWADHRRLTTEVLRLSRLNTNVVSVDVSLHEKRRVTETCRAALSALLAEVQGGPSPSR